MKAQITESNWDFKEIANFLTQQSNILAPSWEKENRWKSCVPQGLTYLDFVHWWLEWSRLGRECDLRDKQWIHQFKGAPRNRQETADLAVSWRFRG